MSVPVVAFFNNKGGVGKTSLVFHVAWMLAELGRRVLTLDLDPQANLTSAFMSEDDLADLWSREDDAADTIYRCVKPLLDVGDLKSATVVPVHTHLSLVPGDLALAGFEDTLAENWPKCLGERELFRSFRVMTAFWEIAQQAAAASGAELILLDVGPNLGAINRSALVASDHVVVPLAGDLFSIQGLRNLGPSLKSWRTGWKKRVENFRQTAKAPVEKAMALPTGEMKPVGYVVQQHHVRLSKPVKAYTRWMDRIPDEYRRAGLTDARPALSVEVDPQCLALFKHYRSLVPMAQEARRPIFLLRPADGAMGSHAAAVKSAYGDFETFTRLLLERIGLRDATKKVRS